MDKRSAINLIENTFNDAFNKERFTYFIRNFLNDLEEKNNTYSGNLIWDNFRDHIKSYSRIGKYIDPEGEALDILIIQVESVTKLERARTSLRNFVIKHLNTFDKDYALVAFYSKEDDGKDWRFSFIKLEYQSYLDKEKQKVKTRKEFTPAKRYSFLVGKYEKSHTAKNQILPLLQNITNNPTINEIESAFSIEKVTDEFFNQYKDLYVKLYEHFKNRLENELVSAGIDTARFTKKLLGQIVFLYFLQKKGWLGVDEHKKWGEGNKRFLQDLFDLAIDENLNFFKDKLQYLFYEALAKERDNDNSFYKRLNCRIPFLNGGLFEAEYNWEKANISIPNDLFRNQEKNKAGDLGTGILDVFDRYNFTIKEDEPLDKEVAVDPEMLGKVFENMLEITERKSKGAFYTPREIVHYMCQESMIHYLDNELNDYQDTYQELGINQTNLFENSKKGQQSLQNSLSEVRVPKEDIEKYIREGHFALEHDTRVVNKGETKTYPFQLPESIREYADVIDEKLTNIRICDPAIGSGAFPVGLLHELVTAQLVIKPHFSETYASKKLKKFKLNKNDNESRYIYRLKKHIIQESIYGVDIDRSAIDIARLRLWLSLVVDEDDLEPIETLPNLDYKIVCGNSLIGMPDGTMRDLKIEEELERLKDKFYEGTNEDDKKELRNTINSTIRSLLDSAEIYAGYKIDFDFKLYFSEVWRKNNGFDVVIGNPPYVGVSKIDYKNTLKKMNYDTYVATGDLYVQFYEMGHKILKQKGNVNFITSNKWINSSYGAKARKYFATKTNPLQLIDFGKVRIFPNATVFVNILMFERAKSNKKVQALGVPGTRIPETSLHDYFKHNKINLEIEGEEIWKISTKKGLEINNRIEDIGIPLMDWENIEFYAGIKTAFNPAYHITKEVRDELIKKDSKSTNIIEPLLRGKDIKRWDFEFRNIYLINSHNGIRSQGIKRIDIPKDYPVIYNYLSKWEDELQKRKDQGDHWTNLRNCAYIEEFHKEKIVWIEISDKANFAFDSKGFHLTNSAYFLSGENLKYLIAVLNSSVFDFYFFQITAKIAGGRKRYTKQYVEKVPIPKISKADQKPFEVLTDYVLCAKQQSDPIVFKYFEQLLDAAVFELYFPKEMKEANKEVIKHLKDLPILNGNSEEEKLATLFNEFERLYSPNHPLRFVLETLDSIEEIDFIKNNLI
ncbi:Eco57I restriction-modification methylase domain-containing protein [Tenacibaculum ascidiaceicola]|uniref:Eco57I restriction-modification methylase domain-containing protein n=1 Tax=Tenacibaculum ascidiaceicola TaxID=1699411 RepID=UPI003CE59022